MAKGNLSLLVHGFPDLARGWRLQMEALAAAGYRAIAPDIRGYGRSSAPLDPLKYTAYQTVGDLVALLDVLDLPTVTVVGHDFGATIAWNAALLRPDRFSSVFCASVPFRRLGERSFLQDVADSGAQTFYMLDQMAPEADELWADASVTYPAFLYWSSGSPPPSEQWEPFAGGPAMVRPAPVAIPPWADPDDTAFAISEFKRTGFHGPLNYYRAIQPFFDIWRPFKGLLIHQPSFFLVGAADGLHRMMKTTEAGLREGLPGLRGFVELPGVGHWPQREATMQFNDALLGFLSGL